MADLPLSIAFWSACAVLGPALGPLIFGFSVAAKGYALHFASFDKR
jgi:hypothetical protein